MSKKRKPNSYRPFKIEVVFIKIYDNSPWPQDYYMCGRCGHAIEYKAVEYHAKTVHKAGTIKLVDVDDSPLTEEEAARSIAEGHQVISLSRDKDDTSV